jgi:FKBP-type peptidyl-prolyl cis-trans isomerase FkpA
MTLSAPRHARTLLTIQAAALAALLASALPVCAQQGAAAPGTAHSKSADSYSLGVSVGAQLHDAGVTSQDVSGERLAAGVQDALANKVKLTPQDRHNIEGLLRRAHEHTAAPNATPPSNSADSYSMGVSMGEQLHASGVTPQDVSGQRLAAGVQDALTAKVKLTPEDEQNITGLLRRSREQAGETNHRAAAAFLAENGRKKDIITTASGLQYKVLAAGSGAPPKATDEVVVNYRGTLIDGTEFDSSYKRGQPATFPVDHVIHGWTEALQLMKPGARYQLFIPPALAYDLQSPPGIPPGSLLLFEVELISVKGQAAATAPASPPAPR